MKTSYFLLPLLLLGSYLFAEEDSIPEICTEEKLEERLCKIEHAFHSKVNPLATIAPTFFLIGDVLYWQARETGLAYAVTASDTVIGTLLPHDFEVSEPEFDWDFGFRVGFGYNAEKDGWDTSIVWTRLHTKAIDQGMLASGEFFLPLWSSPDFIVTPPMVITSTDAHWKLHFNELDWNLGKAYHPTKFLVMRPFIGPSAVRIEQEYHIKYRRAVLTEEDHIHIENEFKGIGARAGCDLQFLLGREWSLMAKASAAIYSGYFDIDRDEDFESPFGKESFDIDQKIHVARPATSLSLGLNWEHKFLRRCAFFRANLSYDIQYFFKQNQMPRVIGKPFTSTVIPFDTFIADQGDLNLHGGSFSLTYGF